MYQFEKTVQNILYLHVNISYYLTFFKSQNNNHTHMDPDLPQNLINASILLSQKI